MSHRTIRRGFTLLAVLVLLMMPATAGIASANTQGCVDVLANHQYAGMERSSPSYSANAIYGVLNFNGSFCTNDVMAHHPSLWIALECRCTDPNAIIQVGIIREVGVPSPTRLFWAVGGCGYTPLAHEDDPLIVLSNLTDYRFMIEPVYSGSTVIAWDLEFSTATGSLSVIKEIPMSDPALCWMQGNNGTTTGNRKAAWLMEGFDRGDSFGSSAHHSIVKYMEYIMNSDVNTWIYPTGTVCSINDRASDTYHPTYCTESNRTFSTWDL